ncbi:hypothetical protein BOTBODRAFT_31072 [Botryobasidium botryosum FD-172 SS1]|uniref:Protein kinase domain-containing protein n=1 Tax=Botryobasidium botryosum (strain FD-172 SS1) TaxID=930990 RepID=A0A067MXZ9_BOTB1|nr:hypothetical protein BOTBODRAFT_31072 [Botryobasidium botryosum FD-172 SS1]
MQVAKGLEYLHEFKPNPVVHGDLRGPNIFISQSGDACIADFGLSELIAETYETNYSTPFITAGHPRWQAPEIIAAATKEAARRNTSTDAFSFGRVMLELFTKKIPFSYIVQDILIGFRVMSGEVPPRPLDKEVVARGLDDAMWDLMMACWAVTPSKRPSTSDLVARLARAIEVRDS